MGWIANLKRGAPAFSNTAEFTTAGGSTAEFLPLSKLTPVVLITQTTGNNAVKLPNPGKTAKGMQLTVVCKSHGGNTLTVGPQDALSADATGERTVSMSTAGEVAQFLWDGSKWNLVDILSAGVAAGSDIS